ncbi:MAG: SDR family NAD(P)-dependent oxidoreductase [Thermaerobacter sp.]|nr:SDR family NAD(P)-dependent oxidoreductase [Thermaerobacter sp.]
MSGSFERRKAFITGAAHGIGRAVAVELARRGAEIVATDVLTSELEETKAAVAAVGGRVEIRALDVTQSAQVAEAMADAARDGLDILVNVAGGVLGQVGRPIEEVTDEEFLAIVRVNLQGVFHTTRAAAPFMKAKGYGRIVNISSGAGRGVSLTGIQAYASAKAGQIGFTRQMAHELGPFGITVNNVAPGFVRSNPTTERQWQTYGEEGQQSLLAAIPVRRLGRAEDIAYAVCFFAAEEAGWITGQTLSVDGGKWMQ